MIDDSYAPGWMSARRFGLPARMLAEATARRRAGDWRGACAAAGFDVRFDLAGIADRHGSQVAARLEADLHHLVPDLVRWHLPRRWRGGVGLIEPELRIPLAEYDGVALSVRTPVHLERPQRIELHCGPSPRKGWDVDRWAHSRYLWDARETPSLLYRLGGGDRAPFFHRDGRRRGDGELPTVVPIGDPVALTEWVMLCQDAGQAEQGWAAAGIRADFSVPDDRMAWRRHRPVDGIDAMVPVLRPLLDSMLRDVPLIVLRTNEGWRADVVTLRRDGGQLTAARADYSAHRGDATVPRSWWERQPDLELLRLGRIEATAIHPLIRAAMFPDAPADETYQPLDSTVDTLSVAVRCRGQWHRVGWQDGRVAPRDHTAEEVRREKVMRSLGGEVPRCFTVTESWQGTMSGRLPRAMRELRHHGMTAIQHGDTDELLRLLELGVDPIGIRDRWERGPLHHLAKVDGERMLGPLLAAGLDINAKDAKGRGALSSVLFDGGSARLVRAMLDAGADPAAVDTLGDTALHLLRSTEATTILPWLLAAGLGLETRDEYGRTPLMTQVLSAAPPETIRSTVEAGADPRAKDEYTEQTIAEMVEYSGRDDLDFLVALGSDDDDEDQDD
jgi:hypothetical protein